KVQKSTKKKRQIIVTTHSKSLLGNSGIDGRSLLILQPSNRIPFARGATPPPRAKIPTTLPQVRRLLRG
ncbi:hypothetical protein AB9F39_39370, partial [Rhizobium leguminosarum]|uniref:hypothetical protein n=1 Tax=Rhizobium leguminosarum TaxID=384 RepID=UPI003F99B0B0